MFSYAILIQNTKCIIRIYFDYPDRSILEYLIFIFDFFPVRFSIHVQFCYTGKLCVSEAWYVNDPVTKVVSIVLNR